MTSPGPRPQALDDLVLRQLLAGRDFARGHARAGELRNFVYLVGSRRTGEGLLVDPAWDIPGLCAVAATEGLRVVGALATHYHPDHVGASRPGLHIPGVAELLEEVGGKVHVHEADAENLASLTGVSGDRLARTTDGDRLRLGGVQIECLHAPGHTPGSQCFLVDGRAFLTGDTLFVDYAGHVADPLGDLEELYRTLNERLARVPDGVILYPGHHKGPVPHRSLGEERRKNLYLMIPDLATWLRLCGRT